MQHDNNIENKLREMEAMEQPDLSQMDNHWQQMQAILQPGSLPVKKGWSRWMLNTLSVAAVVLLITTAVLYLSSKKDSNNENTVPISAPVAEQSDVTLKEDLHNNTVAPFITDSTVKETKAALHISTINPSLIYQNKDHSNGDAKDWTVDDSLLGTVKLNYMPCENCPGKEDAVLSNSERQLRLTNLFTQLEKQQQHFTIDNSRDTLLQFKEGTVVLVPANSFGGMNGIELTAKEFYKTSDIVLNQLNTASNKEQLETGGMLELKANYKGKQVNVNPQKPLTLFIQDGNNDMKDMQLFYGESAVKAISTPVVQYDDQLNNITKKPVSKSINWVPKQQYFLKRKTVTEARVLNVANMPWAVRQTSKKMIGYFMYNGDSITMDKKELKKVLKEKYGYDKVKLTSSIRDRFIVYTGNLDFPDFERRYSEHIGDSLWMEKEAAEKYKLNYTTTRKIVVEEASNNFSNAVTTGQGMKVFSSNQDTLQYESREITKVINAIGYKYSVKLDKLGWINCDRFYTDKRKKINYKVDLGDSATNYYTMLVFDKLNSMMTGYVDGNQVAFQNIPIEEPVKVISIGINKKGETVYSVTHTTTSEQELRGLQFQTTSVPDLRTSLSKLDK